jgi:hypothetical protein
MRDESLNETMVDPLPRSTNHMPNISLSQLKHAKVVDLAEQCRVLNLDVSRSGKRGVSIRNDYIQALSSYVSTYTSALLIAAPISHQLQCSSSVSHDRADDDVHMIVDGQNGDQVRRRVQIQLYKHARDWTPLRSIEYLCGAEGEINLRHVGQQLGIDGIFRVRIILCWQLQRH